MTGQIGRLIGSLTIFNVSLRELGIADLFPINPQPSNLSIKIRKIPSLQQRIVAKTDAWYDMASTKGNLLDFWEEFIDSTIENKLSDRLERNSVFRPNLGRVENVEVEVMLVPFFNGLNGEGPLWETAIGDSLFQILSVKV